MELKPYFIDWAITNKCNLNCKFCTGLTKSELSHEEAIKLASEINSLCPEWVILEGGEPFLRDDLEELLKVLKCKVYIITNGNANINIESLKKFNVGIIFSLDGADGETYKEIRGGDFKEVIERIKLSAEAGLFHGIATILSKKNFLQIEDFFKILKAYNSHLIFIPLKPSKNKNYYNENSLSRNEQLEALKKVHFLSSKYKIQVYYDEPFLWAFKENYGLPFSKKKSESGIQVEEHMGCVAGKTIYIQANGDVNYCMFSPDELKIGNVKEEGLKTLWEKILNSDILKEFRMKEKRKGSCRECEKFYICYGCLSRIFSLSGSHLDSDPACPFKIDE